jgi:two-component system sensor histidine kinase PilS (NtrC family)
LALVHGGLLPPRSLADVAQLPLLRLLNSVLVLGVTCGTAGLIGGWLSESLRQVGRELQDVAGEARDLRELNTIMVDNIRTGLLIADADTRLQHINDFGAALLGRRRDDLLGLTLREAFGSALLASEALEARAARQETARFGLDYDHPDGRARHLGLTMSALGTRVRAVPGGTLLVFQDLTEILRLEQQVRFKEKLAAVGEMAASLAHEIRNPLSSISGSAEVLLTEPGISADQQRLLEIVKRESRRLSNSLNQFLVHVRPPAPAAPVDLEPLVREALALLRNGSEVRPGHRVEYQADGGPHLCQADPDQVVQIFWNLARNGLQAMPRGGRLLVRLGATASDVVLAVSDEGDGIAREQQARLFEPFRSKDGTGLGLAIVYRIVERHRGDIAVRSVPGRGTEVEVRLPLASPPAHA